MKEQEFSKEDIIINYDLIKKVEEHSKKYSSASDKKEFLKNVCAYEQKLILMNSIRPYEVLKYLDELDLKSSRLILRELNYVEIRNLLDLFTSEDKENFYRTFSDLELINQFIMKDKNAKEYIKDLSLDRKIDILDSSSPETTKATSIVYESIPEKNRKEVSNSLTNLDAICALDNSASYKEDTIVSEIQEENTINNSEIIEELLENEEEINKDEFKEENEELFDLKAKEQFLNKITEEEILNNKNDFFKEKINEYKQNPEFKDIDFDKITDVRNLLPHLLEIVERDFEDSRKSQKSEDINKEQERINKRYEKTKVNIEFLKQGTVKDLVEKMSLITIFNNMCKTEDIESLKNNYPDLSFKFKNYLGNGSSFEKLDLEVQDEVLQTLKNNSSISNQILHTLQLVKSSLNESVNKCVENVKIEIFNNIIINNSDELSLLNITSQKKFNELNEEEKNKVINYITNNPNYVEQLKSIRDTYSKLYSIDARCVKEGTKISDLFMSIDEPERFCDLLSPALKNDGILVDRFGNLSIQKQNKKEKQTEVEYYDKYSIIGNGESYLSFLSNPRLVNEFEQQKLSSETNIINQIKNSLEHSKLTQETDELEEIKVNQKTIN